MNGADPFNEGIEHARNGDYLAALDSLQRSLTTTGQVAETYRVMGKVHLRLGELDRARDCWHQALVIDPRDGQTRDCLALLERFHRNRRLLQVLGALAAVVLVVAGLWLQWRTLRAIQKSLVRIEAALPQRTASIGAETPAPVPVPISPAPPPAAEPVKAPPPPEPPFQDRYREAVGVAMRGDIKTARVLLERLADDKYAGQRLAGNVHFWLGRCLFELGEVRPALEQFTGVLERYPRSPKLGDALLDAGRCYLRLGQRDKAEDAWRRLLSGSYDPALQKAARRMLGSVQ
jgi:tetratricopeptide (TPR) repeat protein